MTPKTPLETAQDKIFNALDVRDATGQVPKRLEFTIEERDAIHAEWIKSLNLPVTKT